MTVFLEVCQFSTNRCFRVRAKWLCAAACECSVPCSSKTPVEDDLLIVSVDGESLLRRRDSPISDLLRPFSPVSGNDNQIEPAVRALKSQRCRRFEQKRVKDLMSRARRRPDSCSGRSKLAVEREKFVCACLPCSNRVLFPTNQVDNVSCSVPPSFLSLSIVCSELGLDERSIASKYTLFSPTTLFPTKSSLYPSTVNQLEMSKHAGTPKVFGRHNNKAKRQQTGYVPRPNPESIPADEEPAIPSDVDPREY